MQEKTTWLFELKDKSSAAFRSLDTKFEKIGKNVDHFEKKDPFRGANMGAKKFRMDLQAIRSEIPLLDRSLSLLASPIGGAAAATVGLITVLNKADQAAAKFNNQFLELKNLNLDKTEAQIEKLREKVITSAFVTGRDASQTSTAYFDVQSATGKFGPEVDRIVAKLSKFSTATKADFNTSIEGAAKSMGIFNLNASQLDRFLESSAKTVQVGITTFDQLAKVQVEYAGAAAAANQNFDDANKLFAIFSKNAKSVDIAATLTKTAFQDLTKGSTIKGFEKIGVSLFDAEGKMRSVDRIASDVVPKLQKMSDQDFAKFKEAVGGSEGIKGLLDQLKASGDSVLDTFKQFDQTKYNLNDAFKNALDDSKTLSDILNNQTNTALIKLGENIQPLTNFFKQVALVGIMKIDDNIQGLHKLFNTDHYKRGQLDGITNRFEREAMKRFEENETKAKFNAMGAAGQASFLQKLNSRKGLYEGQLGSDFAKLTPSDRAKLQGKINSIDAIVGMLTSKDKMGADESSIKSTPITGIETVSKSRNVNVTINNLINEVQHIKGSAEGMSPEEFEQYMVELIVRVVRDAEQAISN